MKQQQNIQKIVGFVQLLSTEDTSAVRAWLLCLLVLFFKARSNRELSK